MSANETPRTDAECDRITKEGGYGDDFEMLADFARTLERELADLRARLLLTERMAEALENIAKQTQASELSEEDAADADFEGAYDTCIETARTSFADYRAAKETKASQPLPPAST